MNCWTHFIDWCQRPSKIKIRTFNPRNVMVLATFSIILASSITLGAWRYQVATAPTNVRASESEKPDYQIWIGNGPLGSPEDLVLQSYGDPPKDHLVVENVGYSGTWLPFPTEGKGKYIDIEALTIGPEKVEGEYCGTYDVHKQDLIDALIANEVYPINDKDVYLVLITHGPCCHIPSRGTCPSEESDWWHIIIQWEVGILEIPNDPNPPFIIPHLLILSGYTNMNAAWEGVYDEIADTWAVTFNNAEFKLHENTAWSFDLDTGSGLNKLWDGQLSFTVEIKRILPN